MNSPHDCAVTRCSSTKKESGNFGTEKTKVVSGGAGIHTISVSVDSVSAICTVTVEGAVLSSINISKIASSSLKIPLTLYGTVV